MLIFFLGKEQKMKRCKVIALIICSVVVVICTAMIIRINIQFPKAEDKSYTIDNPADIDGVIVKPLSYQVCTIDEYSQISSEYSKVKDEKKDKCRIVVLTISIENTTEEVADYTPSFIFVSEELRMHLMVQYRLVQDQDIVHCCLMRQKR